MIADVHVLLHALREDSERHAEYYAWLQKNTLNGGEPDFERPNASKRAPKEELT